VLSVIIGVVHTSVNLKQDIWLRNVTSRFENLADGCLCWVNHVTHLPQQLARRMAFRE
jgi:hypothetical protein